jgi:hypothetical protein
VWTIYARRHGGPGFRVTGFSCQGLRHTRLRLEGVFNIRCNHLGHLIPSGRKGPADSGVHGKSPGMRRHTWNIPVNHLQIRRVMIGRISKQQSQTKTVSCNVGYKEGSNPS